MEQEFLGLSMSPKMRMGLLIAIPVAVLCLVLYLVSGFFVQEPEEVLVLPSGGMNDSVFELQNMSYEEVNSLENKINFEKLPYSIDVPDGDFATVDDARFLKSSDYCFYYSNIGMKDNLQDILFPQIISVIAPNYEGNDATYEVVLEESGNLNGCSGTYCIIKVSIPDVAEQYMCVYRLHVDESIYQTEYDFVVGCMGKEYSTKNLAALQKLAYASVKTLRYDRAYADKYFKE